MGKRGLKEPPLGNLGGGSDHIAFYTHVGIPSWGGGTGGPSIYHSNHDSFSFYERFADPSFKMGRLVERVFGVMALRLANADVIPYDISRYGNDLKTHFEGLQKLTKAYDKSPTPFSFDGLIKAADDLKKAGDDCQAALKTVNESNKKAINAELLLLERQWIDKHAGRIATLAAPRLVAPTDALGVPSGQVESVAFAWLAMKGLRREPIDLRAVTGARHPCVLGAIYPA